MNCPICHEPLRKENRTWRCIHNHCFDEARQGYVNLSRKQKHSGDNEEMSRARTAFLETGAYAFMRDALANKIEELHPNQYLDLGCGEGYYTRTFAPLVKEAYGIDLSKPSIAHAAALDKRTQYIVGSIFELPFNDYSMDVLTSVFTPIPHEEASRVLKDDGVLITVTPGRDHHKELKAQLYEKVRLNDELDHIEGFECLKQECLSRTVHVDDVWLLLEMTPYRYKTSKEGLDKIRALTDGLDVTFEFVISTWKKSC